MHFLTTNKKYIFGTLEHAHINNYFLITNFP